MSRGIGKLQREILDSLEASKDAEVRASYRGGTNPIVWPERNIAIPRIARARGMRFLLPDDVYDLAAVKNVMADRDPKRRGPGGEIAEAFTASFSRAVRSLVDRGELVLVSGPRFDEDTDKLETPERGSWQPQNMSPQWRPRQWRFVSAKC